jgi:hypothetical protein
MAPSVETGGKAERLGAAFERSLPDVEPARSDVATVGPQDAGEPSARRPKLMRRSRQSSSEPLAQRGSRRNRRNRGSAIFSLLKRLWILLTILAVIGAGGLTVSRLRGIFGSEKPVSYGDTRDDAAKPFNPKYMRYEIFGPPGTVAQISYFGGKGDPEFIQGVSLPWSLEFPISTAASIGSVAAQGDSDSIGCRITVDGVVKAEKIDHEVSAFTSCVLKAA